MFNFFFRYNQDLQSVRDAVNDALLSDYNRNTHNKLVKKSMKDIIRFYYHYYQNEEDDGNMEEKEVVLRRSERRESMEKDNGNLIISEKIKSNNQLKNVKINEKINQKNLLKNIDGLDLKGIEIPNKRKDKFDIHGNKIKKIRGRPPMDPQVRASDNQKTEKYRSMEYDSIGRTPMENALAYAAMRNKEMGKLNESNSNIKKLNNDINILKNKNIDQNLKDNISDKKIKSQKVSSLSVPMKKLKKETGLPDRKDLEDKV